MSRTPALGAQQAIFASKDCTLSIAIDLGYTTTSIVVRGDSPRHQTNSYPVFHTPDSAREPSKVGYGHERTIFGADVSRVIKHGTLAESSVRHHPKALFVDRYDDLANRLYERDDDQRIGGDDSRQLLLDILKELVQRAREQCKRLGYLSDQPDGDTCFDTMGVHIHFAVPRGLLWDQHLCLLSIAQQLGYPISLYWESDAAAQAFLKSRKDGRLTFASLSRDGASVCQWKIAHEGCD